MDLIVVVALVAVAALVFVMARQPNDPEHTAEHGLDPDRAVNHQPGDARPAGPDAEPMRPLEGTATSATDDPSHGDLEPWDHLDRSEEQGRRDR